MKLLLLFLLAGCGEYNINLVQDQEQCLDVKKIDDSDCRLKTKTYQCVGKGDFTLDINTIK